MDKYIYPWKRRWIPRDHDASENLSDNWVTGFYYTGFSAFSSYEIEELLGVPCLILLGEPGMGKSFAMSDLRTRLINDEENRYYFINLADYESNVDLHQSLFNLSFAVTVKKKG